MAENVIVTVLAQILDTRDNIHFGYRDRTYSLGDTDMPPKAIRSAQAYVIGRVREAVAKELDRK